MATTNKAVLIIAMLCVNEVAAMRTKVRPSAQDRAAQEARKVNSSKTPDLDWPGCSSSLWVGTKSGCEAQTGCGNHKVWLDSWRQSCRYTDEYKLRTDQVAKFYPVELARLEEKTDIFASKGCITGGLWYKCYRRMQQILRLFNYVRKAKAMVLAEGEAHPAFAIVSSPETQGKFAKISANLAEGFGKNTETKDLCLKKGLQKMISIAPEIMKMQEDSAAHGVPLTEEEVSSIQQAKQSSAMLAMSCQDITDEQEQNIRAMIEASGQAEGTTPGAERDVIDDMVGDEEDMLSMMDSDDRKKVSAAAHEDDTNDEEEADDHELEEPDQGEKIYTCGGNAKEWATCSFPFKYKGVEHSECATEGHNQPWCYTQNGKWGNCNCEASPKACNARPSCAHLSGDCCPNAAGAFLECCQSEAGTNSSLAQVSTHNSDGPLKMLVYGGWKGMKWLVNNSIGWLFRRLVWTLFFLVGLAFSLVRAVAFFPILLVSCVAVRSLSWFWVDLMWEGKNIKRGFNRIGHCAPEMYEAVGFDADMSAGRAVAQIVVEPAKFASNVSGVHHAIYDGKSHMPSPCRRVTCGTNAICRNVDDRDGKPEPKCYCYPGTYPNPSKPGQCQLAPTKNGCECQQRWSSWGTHYYGCNIRNECKINRQAPSFRACRRANNADAQNMSSTFAWIAGSDKEWDSCGFRRSPAEVSIVRIDNTLDDFGNPIAALLQEGEGPPPR